MVICDNIGVSGCAKIFGAQSHTAQPEVGVMDEAGFRKYLRDSRQMPKDMPEKTVRSHAKVAKEFESFLKAKGSKRQLSDARPSDVRAFIAHLAKDDRNTFDAVMGLLRYARFCGNKDAELELIYAADGPSVVSDLCDKVKEMHGRRRYEEVLGGFERPPVGTPAKKMPRFTSDLMERMESCLGEAETREVLLTGVHAAPPERHVEEREMFLASKDVDEYLRRRRKRFIELLEGHMKDRALFFDQMIDQDVMDFVRKNHEVASGVRKRNVIYVTKIPYRAIEYLKEKDPKLKRYYGCHCPLARESILSGERMSPNLCYCSAGYVKRPFEVAFGKPVRTEVLESMLWGDPVCRFSIEVPRELLPGRGPRP